VPRTESCLSGSETAVERSSSATIPATSQGRAPASPRRFLTPPSR
jgi:hypothetical protein